MNAAWIAAAVALLALAGASAAWWFRWRRRARSTRRPTAPRYPVVLAHGWFGFDQLKVGGARHDYFRGVPAVLRETGAKVHAVKLPATGSIAERAEALARAIREIDAKRVNVIAHSMGGVDARFAIARLGLSTRIASLTTIGTPHRGTPLADVGTGLIAKTLGLTRLLESLGIGTSAFHDLSSAAMESFNRSIADVRGVSYGCYVARVTGGALSLHPLLMAPYLFLRDRAGDNDGVVPVSSQRWGDALGEIEADHWAQIGWSKGFDAPAFYATLLTELRGRGL